ncbi:MAG: hypothetical protein GY720_00115 [bacterium]|nr:hypothetical protein [bacterium]
MSELPTYEYALEAVGKAEVALAELDANCCVPGRSPRMAKLSHTLSEVRAGIRGLDEDASGSTATLAHLEDAGAQIGSLQIGCCAPSRLPLYTEMLKELTGVQRTITRNLDLAH